MRYKNLIGFVWVAVIMGLFTSCLKDINNVYNPGTTAAGKYGCGTKRVLYGDDTRGNRR